MTIGEQIAAINQEIVRLRSRPRTTYVDGKITQLREKRARLRQQMYRLESEVRGWRP